MGNFDAALANTLEWEGGYVNHPNDPGGETKYGISKRAYPQLDIANLTVEDAKHIYRRDYWEPLKLELVPNLLVSTKIFDMAVNMGKYRAVTLLQQAINYLGQSVDVDGHLGPKTLAAINRTNSKELYHTLMGMQFSHYQTLLTTNPQKFQPFARGWMRRAFGLHSA